MANEEHLKILKQGVEAWNGWREENPAIEPDLSRTDLPSIDLIEANLRGTNLRETNLRGINLVRADLSGANLSGADLSEAHLISANLTGAKLTGAKLERAFLSSANLRAAKLTEAHLGGANLIGAILTSTNLKGTNFIDAKLGSTIFVNVDLSVAQGLDSVEHHRPSSLSVDTIYRSKGRIPTAFLQGCGIPDTMIAYIGTLADRPTQYYSCFISYSSQDRECAERLYTDLQGQGVRCWFAPEDMKTGDKMLDRIDQEIRVFDKLLLIFSEHSIDNDWVETEVQAALGKERQTRRTVLFPIRLDDVIITTCKAWAIKVWRERHITDFTNWKNHDTYQRQFARLLRDLQAVDAQEVSAVEPVPSPKPKSKPTETYRVKLRQNLVAAFNDSELRDLCFDMNVDYESLNGENKADKARELIAFCERRQSVPDLVARCRELRPKVEWGGEYE